MLEESQVVFHVDLEDEEIILPSAQGGLRDGHRDWNGKSQQGVGIQVEGMACCQGWDQRVLPVAEAGGPRKEGGWRGRGREAERRS